MANVKEKIAALCPEATFEEGEQLLITIPDARWHDMAATLKNDLGYDYLTALIGMDWTESLGVMYYLTNTAENSRVAVKVSAADREHPMLHSISDLYAVANLYEREVYDYFGIIFINHPDMRRLFLRNDWVGYPLRKDYDDSPNINPVRLDHETPEDVAPSWVELPDGKIVKELHDIFKPDEFIVNIGPQHPATHGVLRFRTAVEGETIKKIDLYLGYIHRGIEKICESLTYPQTLHFTDRLDYLSAMIERHGICLCIEKALNLEVPRRALVIRCIMDELMRISSHLLFMGTFCMDLGATTMLFYTLRERETILNIFEKTCGARMTFNYNCIGGIMDDIHEDFVKDVKALLAIMPGAIKEYNTIFTGNVIARNRMDHVGNLSKADAISYGVTGPNGRGSGWACDVRKRIPYGIYNEVEFDEITLPDGDCTSRFLVRIEEIKQSCRIIEQLIDNIPEGPIRCAVPKVYKLPAGHWFQQVESSRGAFGVYIESTGTTSPWRVKLNSPCMNAAGVVDHITRGSKIADLITIGGTLDYIVPDIDR